MSKMPHQLNARRLALGLRQEDMVSRTGMSRQQYQRLERQGNPRLQPLEFLAKGLKVRPDNEFPLFAHMGADLPGAHAADPVDHEKIPDGLLKEIGNAKPIVMLLQTAVLEFPAAAARTGRVTTRFDFITQRGAGSGVC